MRPGARAAGPAGAWSGRSRGALGAGARRQPTIAGPAWYLRLVGDARFEPGAGAPASVAEAATRPGAAGEATAGASRAHGGRARREEGVAGDPAAVAPEGAAAPAPPDTPAAGPAPGGDRGSFRLRWLEVAAFGVLLAGALVAAALLGTRGEGTRSAAAGFAVFRGPAEPAPEFELPGLDGRRVGLRALRGRVVLVNFWATWCAPCREEMPALDRLARELAPRGLVVLAVNHQEDAEGVRAFVRELGLGLPVLLDAEGTVAERYRVRGLPTTAFVARDGTLVGVAVGYRDWAGVGARAYLDELLGARGAAAGGAPGG